MPLDPDKPRQVTEKSETLSKRFDALMERRKADPDAEDEDADEDEEDLEGAAERATEASSQPEIE